MANIKSAKKRIRVIDKKTARNRRVKDHVKTALKNFDAAKALARQLSKLVKHRYDLKVLVVGLGNEKVTPDSLGPHTVSKIKITSHLFKIFGCDGDEEMSNVSGLAPGVTATTGMETAELIEKAVAAFAMMSEKDLMTRSMSVEVTTMSNSLLSI